MQIRLYLTNVQRIRNKTYIYIYPILVTLILHIHAINAKFPKEIPLNLYPILNYSLSSDNETSTRTTSSRNIIHDLILSRLDSGICGITNLTINEHKRSKISSLVWLSRGWPQPGIEEIDHSCETVRVIGSSSVTLRNYWTSVS